MLASAFNLKTTWTKAGVGIVALPTVYRINLLSVTQNIRKILTHIQLPYETRHIVVLIIQWQYLTRKLSLILNDETFAILILMMMMIRRNGRKREREKKFVEK